MKYFKKSEFDSPDRPGSGSRMEPEFLERLDKAREISGIPYKIKAGFKRIGLADTFIHVDSDPHKPDAYWSYDH